MPSTQNGAPTAMATTPPSMLKSVSAAFLANVGIELKTPTSSAKVSEDAAQQAAVRQIPGSAVRETVLADFSNTHRVPAISTLAWVVSLTVPSGFRMSSGPFPGRSHQKPSYLVVFIDARTGDFIQATSGGRL